MNIVFVCAHCKVETDINHMTEHWFEGLAKHCNNYFVKAIYIPEVGKTIKKKLSVEQFEEMYLFLTQMTKTRNELSPFLPKIHWNGK